MNDTTPDVAIVGAGPYGLSLAAHLRARGVKFRIFGPPMKTWRDEMPPGMLLKSDGFASNLSDPAGACTLGQFCKESGESYDDRKIPVRLETFVNYGLAFQKRMVPELEEDWVTGIEKNGAGFQLTLQSGEKVQAKRVVLAIGITCYAYTPPELAGLGPERVIHTSLCNDGNRFRGKKVAVIGAGSSAMDTAAYLHESGAEVCVIARSPNIYFGEPPSPNQRPRSLWQRIRHPSSGIGTSLRSRIYCDAPWLFHLLPERLRLRIVKRHLGPASGWPLRERVMGRMPLYPSTVIRRAELAGDGVVLTLAGPDGVERVHKTDMVVAGTGYRVDLERLTFLPAELRAGIRAVQNTPVLSGDFESSLPGLYFTGVSAANSFGPVMRFAFGADYTARKLAGHLAARSRRGGGH
ncbi:MAG: NAD(P)-binding domain-containing protein [Chthoniobacteraceae bacterium]